MGAMVSGYCSIRSQLFVSYLMSSLFSSATIHVLVHRAYGCETTREL